MAGLDEIRTIPNGERGKCIYEDGKDAAAYVEVRVREKGATRKTVTTKSVGVCEEHAVELFKDIVKTMERKR